MGAVDVAAEAANVYEYVMPTDAWNACDSDDACDQKAMAGVVAEAANVAAVLRPNPVRRGHARPM